MPSITEAAVNKQKQQEEFITLWTKPKGLNTVLPATFLDADDLVEAKNFKYNAVGVLETREGLTRVTTSPCAAAIKTICKTPIGSATYLLLVDATYKLYKCSGSAPNLNPGTAVATLEGDTQIVPFNSYAVLLDGSYIKLYNGTTVTMAYDSGSGSRGYQYNNTCGVSATAAKVSLYSGAKTRAANKVTTSSWTAGYTIPIIDFYIWLSKYGSPTGAITAKVWNGTTGAVVATSSTSLDAGDLTTTSVRKNFTFLSTDLLSPSTDYYFGVEFSGGDASNYVIAAGSTVSSSGKTYYYDGSWHNISTSTLLLGFGPNVPPKGKFGDTKDARLFVSGDPNYPGYVWFSQVNTALDWSTSNAAGYVSAVDDDANSFAVGAIKAHYGDLYVFGTSTQPYICKLTGASPGDFALPPLFQQCYTTQRGCLSIINDVWFVSGDSVYALSGVQVYGDVRASDIGFNISDKIKTYWSTACFSAFNPKDGQVLIKLAGYDNILVAHTRIPLQDRIGRTTYPWTEYALKGLTPTAFANVDGTLYIGCSDGHLYTLDTTVVKDNGTLPDYSLKSGIIEMPFGNNNITGYYFPLYSSASAIAKLAFYQDGKTSFPQLIKTIETSDKPIQGEMNIACESLQVAISDMDLTAKTSIRGLTLRNRKLSRPSK